MKVAIKNNYGLHLKGSKFNVIELVKNRITLLIDGNKVDFSIKEVEFETNFETGRFFNNLLANSFNLNMRDKDIKDSINLLGLNKIEKVIFKNLNLFLYGSV